MPGQATVTIGENQWAVSVASSVAELQSGLSGVESILPGTGMLFNMGSDQSYITINMSEMLFSLDIVFINSEHGVVGVLHDVEPGEEAAFDAGNGFGAMYFLEVNAGEMINVNVGDDVSISGDVQPSFWAGLITAVMAMSQVAIVGVTTYGVVKEELKKSKNEGHHSIGEPDRSRLVKVYGTWAVGRAESVCPRDDVLCVEEEAAEFLTRYKAKRWT